MQIMLTYIVVIGLSVLFGGAVGYWYVKLFVKFYEWFSYWWMFMLPKLIRIIRSKFTINYGGRNDVHVQ